MPKLVLGEIRAITAAHCRHPRLHSRIRAAFRQPSTLMVVSAHLMGQPKSQDSPRRSTCIHYHGRLPKGQCLVLCVRSHDRSSVKCPQTRLARLDHIASSQSFHLLLLLCAEYILEGTGGTHNTYSQGQILHRSLWPEPFPAPSPAYGQC